jgi:hypothetical protein
MRRTILLAGLGGVLFVSSAAHAEVAGALRAGTLGIGADVTIGMTETLNVRLGYSAFSYDREIEDTDLTYDGELKLSNAQALLDWHAFGGGFRFTIGAVGGGTELEVQGEPSDEGTYEIGGETFTAAQVGSVEGTAEFGNSVLPYIGFGWGNPVDAAGRVSFLVDVGAIYGGTPDVNIRARCGTAAPAGSPQCARLQAAVDEERADLEEEVTLLEWYPVLSLGISVKF